MMRKLMLLGAGAVGYVLGTRAGRERYDQIMRQAQRVRSNPAVQQKVEEAKHAAKDVAGTATEKVKEKTGRSQADDTSGLDETLATPTAGPVSGTTAANTTGLSSTTSSSVPDEAMGGASSTDFGRGDEEH